MFGVCLAPRAASWLSSPPHPSPLALHPQNSPTLTPASSQELLPVPEAPQDWDIPLFLVHPCLPAAQGTQDWKVSRGAEFRELQGRVCCTLLPPEQLWYSGGANITFFCLGTLLQPPPVRGWDRISHKQPVLGASSYLGKEKGGSSSSSPAHFPCQWPDFLVQTLQRQGDTELRCWGSKGGAQPS